MNRQEFEQNKNKLKECPECLQRMRYYNLRKHLNTHLFLSNERINEILKEVLEK